MAKGELVQEINELKNKTGNGITVYGGDTFVWVLNKAGLIDEFHVFINPVMPGSGITIFSDIDYRQNLSLAKSQAFNCGVTVLNYAVEQG